MPNNIFNRQRSALNVLSVAIIIYFITGMEFNPQGFAAITIKHTAIAYAVIWVTFFYFWWRFHLYGQDVRQRWKLNFLYQLSKNEKYRRLYEQPEGAHENDPTIWAPSVHGEGFKRYLSWDKAYLVGVKTEDGGIQLAEKETFREPINPLTQKWSVGPETIIPLSWHQYFLPALKANLAAISNKSGTEWALPNFLAFLALTCGVAALATHIR